MNVVIPAAGNGRRFFEAGYTEPKPLLDVLGKPMIQRVVECINLPYARYIFIVQQDHVDKFGIDKQIKKIVPNSFVITLPYLTRGAAETVLCAKPFLNLVEPLVICNSDQYFKYSSHEVLLWEGDARILTFTAHEEKWSFAKVEGEKVVEVAEKKIISDHATIGYYYFRRAENFTRHAEAMIHANERTNNEFYVCPVFNRLIAAGLDVRWQDVEEMHGLGTPEDYHDFIEKFQGKL